MTCSPIKRLQSIDLTEFGVMTKIYGRAFVAGVIPVKVGASVGPINIKLPFFIGMCICRFVFINY